MNNSTEKREKKLIVYAKQTKSALSSTAIACDRDCQSFLLDWLRWLRVLRRYELHLRIRYCLNTKCNVFLIVIISSL